MYLHILERKAAKKLGLLRYFTGRPCKYGHFSERRTSIGHCVECLRVLHASPEVRKKNKARYEANSAARVEYTRQWRLKNPVKREALARKNYLENRDAVIKRTADWRAADPERARALNRKVYQKDLEYNRLRNRAWAIDNPQKVAAGKAYKRALVKQATPSKWRELTLFVHEEALLLARQRTALFGFPWHVDHMVPLKGRGFVGLHIWYNLQVIPAGLNLLKGNKLMFTEPFNWIGEL